MCVCNVKDVLCSRWSLLTNRPCMLSVTAFGMRINTHLTVSVGVWCVVQELALMLPQDKQCHPGPFTIVLSKQTLIVPSILVYTVTKICRKHFTTRSRRTWWR